MESLPEVERRVSRFGAPRPLEGSSLRRGRERSTELRQRDESVRGGGYSFLHGLNAGGVLYDIAELYDVYGGYRGPWSIPRVKCKMNIGRTPRSCSFSSRS